MLDKIVISTRLSLKTKMLVLSVVLSSICTGTAKNIVTPDEVQVLFKNYLANKNLSEVEIKFQNDVFEILRRPTYLTLDVQPQPEVRWSLDCLICRSALAAAITLVKDGASDESLTSAFSTLCYILNVQSENVCRGAVSLNLHIITYIVKHTPEVTARNFCGLILQMADDPTFCTYDDARFDWQVDLPAQTQTEEPSNKSQKPLTVAVVTDSHIDLQYEPFGVADCDEPTCCRKGQKPRNLSILHPSADTLDVERNVISTGNEVELDISNASTIREMRLNRPRYQSSTQEPPAGYWGDYRNCDTPKWAFDDVIERVADTHKFDVVYYLGDTVDHGVWETSYDGINEVNAYLVSKMRTSFGDEMLIVPVIGNHESQPTNQFAPPTITEPKLNTTWLYEALVKKWDRYLTEEAKASLRVRGDFSIQVRPGLKAISLNSNAAYRYNWWLVYDPLEPKHHLDWLVQELYSAELLGEKVHILTHFPPGVHDLAYVWTREYARIVDRFSSTIAAEFNGHVHSDEFKIFYNLTNDAPINVAWGAGSATSYTNYNLNYKIVTFDGDTYAPLNIVNYVYNLTEANLTPNRRPHWFQLYDIKNNFALNDLSAPSMDNLVRRMVTSNRNLLDLYSAYFSKLSDTRWPNCNHKCKLDNLCKIVTTVLWRRNKCEELTGLLN